MEIAQSIGLQPFNTRDTAGIPQIEDEQILQHFPEIQLIVATDAELGYGTLHITDSQVIWLPTDLTSQGYSIPFTSISMHAISSNPEENTTPDNTPPCLYVQLDTLDDNDNATVPELRLIPKDDSLLDSIFQSFCQGAERNPDPNDDDDDNGNGGFFFNKSAQMMEGQDDDRFDDNDDDDDR